MSKYSNELKFEVVKYYIEEHHSYSECCKKFNIAHISSIERWVKKYQENGPIGLMKQLKSSYDGNFKQNVIEYMHDNHLSANQAACIFNLGNHNVVLKWERIYYEEGPQALYVESRGRPRKMNPKKTIKNKKDNINENEDLLEEVQRLRMENEYLKKLNALVQKRIKQETKKK